ncbi:MAG: leucine--tRNA ligase [Patescibacteria group bacterium]|nr:leucine--tRNA ligase [Patescibacteria group bacterium]
MPYDHKNIEQKWQKAWEEAGLFRAEMDPTRKKFYALDMFPYPSGDGLHVGHPESYTATDILAHKRRMEGFNVMRPVGFDAFGLPAENYAIKKGIHPRETTYHNIENFRRQMRSFGFCYDWSREVITCDPAYYRWTQWLFLFLYKRGLAFRRTAPVNWCDSCQTVLANEQVEDGKCERCKNMVRQKELKQWFFGVTQFADRLLADLDGLDWPEKIKTMQRHWIGRSEGAEIAFRGQQLTDTETPADDGLATEVSSREFEIAVFTTRPDTLFGVQWVVLAPEHPLVMELVTPDRRKEVVAYVEAARHKSELERTGTELEKTGVSLGVCVKNPLTGEDVPIWIADYVLANYGTGAVMGVPAHDERDYAFAKKYGFPIKTAIVPPVGALAAPVDAAYTESGILMNSGEFNGLMNEDAMVKITDALEAKNRGRRQVQYHLRDWLISRQRYWGAPIPIIYCEHCGEVPVPEEDLPVLLPDDVDFRPTGESPLVRSESFHKVECPRCHEPARRESDTMDTFVDSSWYFLRYASPHQGDRAFDSHAVNYWCPVDLYVGGAEHAVLHLLYARFFTKALFDAGMLPFDEPFLKLRNQGLILGENGVKMSKSLGNVVNPDDVVERHGADTMRLYEMFMGEFSDAKPWDTKGIIGVRRFLDRLWAQVHDRVHANFDGETPEELTSHLHRTIRKVSSDIEEFKFNTAIAAMMILLNEWQRLGGGDRVFVEAFLRLLAPFAPHLAEDLWQTVGNSRSIFLTEWPAYDEALAAVKNVEIVVQVGGKVRDRLTVPTEIGEEDVKAQALALEKVQQALVGKEIAQVIVVKGRLVNVVVK